jgi:hypothetical protein
MPDKIRILTRVSDKSGVFHIGYKGDYEKKVLFYQENTKAYVELPFNPLMKYFINLSVY